MANICAINVVNVGVIHDCDKNVTFCLYIFCISSDLENFVRLNVDKYAFVLAFVILLMLLSASLFLFSLPKEEVDDVATKVLRQPLRYGFKHLPSEQHDGHYIYIYMCVYIYDGQYNQRFVKSIPYVKITFIC